MKIVVISSIMIVSLILSGCSQSGWLGFYYPDGNIAGDATYSPEFKTREECIRWAENIWHSRPSDRNIHPQDLYECGKNCKLRNASLGLYECKVTFDGGDWRRGDYGE